MSGKFRRERVVLQDKIQIFEEFMRTGKKLRTDTVYKGYPIGMWVNQIINQLKRLEKGESSYIKPSEEQLKKLKSLGILEKMESDKFDEIIDVLVYWGKKYPKINPITTRVPKSLIREIASSDEEYEELVSEYRIANKYYNIITQRLSEGKITEEQRLKCKEANVGGVFGFPTKIEDLAKEYKQDEVIVNHIINNYGTMENFVIAFENDKLAENDTELAQRILRRYIDLDGHEYCDCYAELVADAYEKKDSLNTGAIRSELPEGRRKVVLFSSNNIYEKIAHKSRVMEKYGLNDGIPKICKEVGEKYDVSIEAVASVIRSALRRYFYLNPNVDKILFNDQLTEEEMSTLTEEEKEQFADLERNVYIVSRFKPSPKYANQSVENDIIKQKNAQYVKFIQGVRQREKEPRDEEVSEIQEEVPSEIQEKLNVSIEELNLSVRAHNSLMRRGIKTLGDLLKLSESDIYKIKYLPRKNGEEIIDKLKDIKASGYLGNLYDSGEEKNVHNITLTDFAELDRDYGFATEEMLEVEGIVNKMRKKEPKGKTENDKGENNG